MDAAAGAAIPGSVSALFVFLTRPYSLPSPSLLLLIAIQLPTGSRTQWNLGLLSFF